MAACPQHNPGAPNCVTFAADGAVAAVTSATAFILTTAVASPGAVT